MYCDDIDNGTTCPIALALALSLALALAIALAFALALAIALALAFALPLALENCFKADDCLKIRQSDTVTRFCVALDAQTRGSPGGLPPSSSSSSSSK